MRNLFVLFDPKCAFCRKCKLWLQSQNQIVPLTFIEAASDDAKRIFPAINHAETLSELTVISDSGGIYHSTKAWLICLWALRSYRGWASTLSTPELMPLAKKFITMVSDNRKTISQLIC
jgi:predicted DCC family thiol-disulfide oxidoreductase YuxK